MTVGVLALHPHMSQQKGRKHLFPLRILPESKALAYILLVVEPHLPAGEVGKCRIFNAHTGEKNEEKIRITQG